MHKSFYYETVGQLTSYHHTRLVLFVLVPTLTFLFLKMNLFSVIGHFMRFSVRLAVKYLRLLLCSLFRGMKWLYHTVVKFTTTEPDNDNNTDQPSQPSQQSQPSQPSQPPQTNTVPNNDCTHAHDHNLHNRLTELISNIEQKMEKIRLFDQRVATLETTIQTLETTTQTLETTTQTLVAGCASNKTLIEQMSQTLKNSQSVINLEDDAVKTHVNKLVADEMKKYRSSVRALQQIAAAQSGGFYQ
jgi:hypothetical protein